MARGETSFTPAPADDPTLFQRAEMTLGQASAVLQRTRELRERLIGPIPEKSGPEPQTLHNNPTGILLDAYTDMRTAESIIQDMIDFVGLPGQGR